MIFQLIRNVTEFNPLIVLEPVFILTCFNKLVFENNLQNLIKQNF
jgi:hypothetical protein